MHKRLWIIFGTLAAAVVLVVVLGVTFSIGKVEVNTTSDITLASDERSKIVELSGIKKGNNIFAVDEKIAVENIEVAMPTIKVISIERKFPNNVHIYVTRRTAVFSLRLDDGRYAILDRELKIIDINSVGDGALTQLSGITAEDAQVGKSLVDTGVLPTMIKGAEKCSFINGRFCAFFRKIDVGEENIVAATNTGVLIYLPISANVDDAVIGAYSYYANYTSNTGKTSGRIYLSKDGWDWENLS